ncbi:MAG: fumarylacetoacetate hydrolase family protein [Bacteroidetes bacterium]|nr:fumarylacetoacetate hydrolase family protein [Bacteroidota bacterium]
MKLVRWGLNGEEKPGIWVDGKMLDVSAHIRDYDAAFFVGGGLQQLTAALETHTFPVLPANIRLGCPVANPSKIICVGLNYAKHAAETGAAVPTEPIIFLKATSAITGPYDVIQIPRNSTKTDWEVELAVVIGKRASYVTLETAMDYVAGYCLHNDVSERAFQLERGGTWDKGKGCDSFAPLGPWMVTKDEIPNPHNLRLWLKVNEQTMQDGNTDDLIFDIPTLVSYISSFMTLLPGDIISTGTPSGVGMGIKPAPIYLKPGDVVELGIDGLGCAQQTVVAAH